MRIDVAAIADFKREVRPALEELQESGNTGDDVLEVVIAPGEYEGKNILLGDDDGNRPVHLILRAADPKNPPVFTDLYMKLSASQVTADGLVLRDNYYSPSVFRIAGAQTLTLQNCAFIGNGTGPQDNTQVLEMVADHDDCRAVLENCWLINNRTAAEGTLLAFRDGTGSYRQISLRNCALLNNQTQVLIAPYVTTRLEMQACFVYEPGEKVLVAVNNRDTGVRLSDSIIGMAAAENVFSFWSHDAPPDAFQPSLVTKTAFTFSTDGGRLSGKSQQEQVTMQAATLMTGAALEKHLAHFVGQAVQGIPPDIDALRKAFGLH